MGAKDEAKTRSRTKEHPERGPLRGDSSDGRRCAGRGGSKRDADAPTGRGVLCRSADGECGGPTTCHELCRRNAIRPAGARRSQPVPTGDGIGVGQSRVALSGVSRRRATRPDATDRDGERGRRHGLAAPSGDRGAELADRKKRGGTECDPTGGRPRVKRLALCVAMALMLGAFALGQTQAWPPAPPTPQKPTLSLTPAVVMARGSFGQSLTQTLTLTNETNVPFNFVMVAQDVTVKDGKRVFVPAGETKNSIAATAVFSQASGTVKP